MARVSSDRAGGALSKHGYKQLKKIGEGSFGAAILVQHEKEKAGDLKMICKMIDISRASKQEKEDAVKESKVLSSLKHPYIVRYRESFHEDGWLCIVMDYCEGGDLSEKIKKMRSSGRTFPEAQVVRWFTQAILALKYIHDMHILHRDLKSGNFFLSKSGNLKMGDFGIAKVLECTAACAQTQIGTPYYLSPEICQGKAYSWGSDIWSMGCILHEMCSRRVPFDAPDLKSLIKKITSAAPPDLPAEYSQGLKALARELLDRDPSKRPQASVILKRPVVQEMVRKMLDEVKEDDEPDEKASKAPSSSPAPSSAVPLSSKPDSARGPSSRSNEQDANSQNAGTYVKNQAVEYYSETHGEWLPAQVTNADPDGRIMLNVKPNVWISIDVQCKRVRPRASASQQSSAEQNGARAPSSRGRPPAAEGRPPADPHGPRGGPNGGTPAAPERHMERRPSRGGEPQIISRQGSRDRMDAPGGVGRHGGMRQPSPRHDVPAAPPAGMQRVPSQDRAVRLITPGRQPSPSNRYHRG
mmetsp:Transcript_50930/g.146317  ORF Transcript_50930/g.146317 Transcript_50930/m.146317 type:complete len:526 (-) Transcript_50930:438-2015(-)